MLAPTVPQATEIRFSSTDKHFKSNLVLDTAASSPQGAGATRAANGRRAGPRGQTLQRASASPPKVVTNFGGFKRAPAQQGGSGLPQLHVQPSPTARQQCRPLWSLSRASGRWQTAQGPAPALPSACPTSPPPRQQALLPPPPPGKAPGLPSAHPSRTTRPAARRGREPAGTRSPMPRFRQALPPRRGLRSEYLRGRRSESCPGLSETRPPPPSSLPPAARPLPKATAWPRAGEGAAPPPPGAVPGRGRGKPRRRAELAGQVGLRNAAGRGCGGVATERAASLGEIWGTVLGGGCCGVAPRRRHVRAATGAGGGGAVTWRPREGWPAVTAGESAGSGNAAWSKTRWVSNE